MDIKQLRYFVEVARRRSFTAAAKGAAKSLGGSNGGRFAENPRNL